MASLQRFVRNPTAANAVLAAMVRSGVATSSSLARPFVTTTSSASWSSHATALSATKAPAVTTINALTRAFSGNAHPYSVSKSTELKREAVDEELLPVPDGEETGSDFEANESLTEDQEILDLFSQVNQKSPKCQPREELVWVLARSPVPNFQYSFPIVVHPLLRRNARVYLDSFATTEGDFNLLARCARHALDVELVDLIIAKAKTANVKLTSTHYSQFLQVFTHLRNEARARETVTALEATPADSWNAQTYISVAAAQEVLLKAPKAAEATVRNGVESKALPLYHTVRDYGYQAIRVATGIKPAQEQKAKMDTIEAKVVNLHGASRHVMSFMHSCTRMRVAAMFSLLYAMHVLFVCLLFLLFHLLHPPLSLLLPLVRAGFTIASAIPALRVALADAKAGKLAVFNDCLVFSTKKPGSSKKSSSFKEHMKETELVRSIEAYSKARNKPLPGLEIVRDQHYRTLFSVPKTSIDAVVLPK